MKRFIPTYVGNTRLARPIWPMTPVHPHVCGEHRQPQIDIQRRRGSSPRMWGTPELTRTRATRARFIPTYVGNTRPQARPPWRPAVHPHVCGEHLFCIIVVASVFGSSPRMWGTRCPSPCPCCSKRFIPTYVGNTRALRHVGGCGRFIPTYVGNTRWRRTRWSPSPVHPHVCGEHTMLPAEPVTLTGSSPRMWGTHQERNRDADDFRFIPTYVGNTLL